MDEITVWFDESGNSGAAATAADWSAFGAWADSLDVDDYGAVVHLWEQGWEDDLPALESQLRSGLEDDAPEYDGAKRAAEGLLELVEARADADTALAVSDGEGE